MTNGNPMPGMIFNSDIPDRNRAITTDNNTAKSNASGDLIAGIFSKFVC